MKSEKTLPPFLLKTWSWSCITIYSKHETVRFVCFNMDVNWWVKPCKSTTELTKYLP